MRMQNGGGQEGRVTKTREKGRGRRWQGAHTTRRVTPMKAANEKRSVRQNFGGRQHCHETMQPFVNHLANVSRSISRVLHHAPTNQWLFNCSIQWTTSRRRINGDFTGKSLAFSASSIGRAYGGSRLSRSAIVHGRTCVRACPPGTIIYYRQRQRKYSPWPSSN